MWGKANHLCWAGGLLASVASTVSHLYLSGVIDSCFESMVPFCRSSRAFVRERDDQRCAERA